MDAAVAKNPSSPFSAEVESQLISWLSHPDRHMELFGGRLVSKFTPGTDQGRPMLTEGKHGAAQLAIGTQIMRLQGPEPSGGPGGTETRWWITQEVDLYIGGEGMRPDLAGWTVIPPHRQHRQR